MSDSDLDDRLRRYLDREDEAPIHATVRRIVDQMNVHEIKDVERHEELRRITDSHHHRITTLESRATELAREVEDTGRYHVDELTRKVRRTDATIYKAGVLVVAALIGAGVVASVQALASGRAVPSPAVDSRPGSK